MELSLVGVVGRVTISIPAHGPGEIVVPVRGGHESYSAWADEPIVRGTRVVVIDHPSARSVVVSLMS